MRTIAIDFDGVIHTYKNGWGDGVPNGEPMEGAEETIRYLLRDYCVFVFSARDPQAIQDWFGRMLGGKFVTQIIPEDDPRRFWDEEGVVGISRLKLPAVAYIDDRAIRFTNWQDIKNYF